MAIENTYVPIDDLLIIDEMIQESLNSQTSFRKSLNKSKGILKFDKKYPNTMSGKTKYNHTEIQQFFIDNAAEWIK